MYFSKTFFKKIRIFSISRVSGVIWFFFLFNLSFTTLWATTFNLETATIADINKAFSSGALTSEKLVQLYLKRIEAYDQQGPHLNTIITLNPKALERARILDKERQKSGPRSLVHGIPIVVKDLFNTHDMPTTAGFLPMAKSQPWRDAFVIRKLRQNGAIILAKVNLSDWFGKAPSGASTITGQPQNPYKLGYIPGASSSGTAVAVSAYFSTVGLGTETGTSIRNPAANNNLIALAPTQGLVSRAGVVSNSITQDRAGPMARSVYDLAAVLSAISGFDPEDLYTQASIGKIPPKGYTSFIDKNGLRGARLGVLRDLFSSTPPEKEGIALIETAIMDIQKQGAIVLDNLTTGTDLFAMLRNLWMGRFEKKSTVQMYLDQLGTESIFKSMQEMADDYPDLVKESTITRSQVGPLDQNKEYASALKTRKVTRQLIVSLMDQYELDALIYPVRTLPAWKINEGMSSSEWYEKTGAEAHNRVSAVTDLPALVVPAGFTQEGIPISLEFLGRPYSEPTLIRLASGYEHVINHRKTPPHTPPLKGEIIHY